MIGEPATSQNDGNRSNVLPQTEGNPSEAAIVEYSGWMNALCREPPFADAETCCLGFWLPWVLFGKIDERLELVHNGQDPNEARSGCNRSCLMYAASCQGFCGELPTVNSSH